MFAIGVNSQWWSVAPGAAQYQSVVVPPLAYLNAINAALMVLVDNTANPATDAQIVISPPGPSTGMGNYCHAVPAFPIYKTIKAGAHEVISIFELFATAADYTIKPPTEVPQPPFPSCSYSRGLKNVGSVAVRAMVAIAGMGFPIDWAGTTGPWFTWERC